MPDETPIYSDLAIETLRAQLDDDTLLRLTEWGQS
jgi:hypothetical protein